MLDGFYKHAKSRRSRAHHLTLEAAHRATGITLKPVIADLVTLHYHRSTEAVFPVYLLDRSAHLHAVFLCSS